MSCTVCLPLTPAAVWGGDVGPVGSLIPEQVGNHEPRPRPQTPMSMPHLLLGRFTREFSVLVPVKASETQRWMETCIFMKGTLDQVPAATSFTRVSLSAAEKARPERSTDQISMNKVNEMQSAQLEIQTSEAQVAQRAPRPSPRSPKLQNPTFVNPKTPPNLLHEGCDLMAVSASSVPGPIAYVCWEKGVKLNLNNSKAHKSHFSKSETLNPKP